MRDEGIALLNLTEGGEGGYSMPEETRKKISAGRKGKHLGPLTDECKRKISEALKGRPKPPMSQSHRENIRRAATGIKKSEDTLRKMSVIMTNRMTPEARAIISAQHKGRPKPKSAEARRNMSEAKKRWYAEKVKTT